MKSFADPIMMTATSDPNRERRAVLFADRMLDAIPSDVRAGGELAKTHSRTKPQPRGRVSKTRLTLRYRGGRAPPQADMAGVAGAADTLNGREPLIAFAGRIAVTALSLLSFYTLLLSVLPQFMAASTVNFAISPFIITLFAAVMGPVTVYSGFPRSFLGLQTGNWKSALAFSVLVSLAFLAAAVALKLILIHTTETFSSLSLFGCVRGNMHQVTMPALYWLQVGLYLVLAPVQEFVARCCLQAPLYAFLNGTEFRRHVSSILVSNLVFAAVHAHIGLPFAVAAFIPGLFWGWIFARTHSFIAVAASHFMIGGAGIFLLGIEGMAIKLMG
jgi:membrane protease YdiL (CAAX protease family)